MKHFFLDTNIGIDFLANRKPFSIYAAGLFELAYKKKVNLYISAVSYNTIFYILQQSTSNTNAIKLLASIEELSETMDVTREVIRNSLKSEFKDFEDAIQYYTALSNKKIDVIVTRNGKDFKKSTISVLSPQEALLLI
jgi:predicted nucleic acid-binding protein